MKISTRSFCQSFNPLLQRFFSSSPSRFSSRKMMKKWEQINIIQTVTDKLKKVTLVPHSKCISCLSQWLITVDIHVQTQSSRVNWWIEALRACCDILALRSQTHKRLQGNKCISQFIKVSFPTIFFKSESEQVVLILAKGVILCMTNLALLWLGLKCHLLL